MDAKTSQPYDYDRATALVVVDMQNDFADPKGSLFVSGGDDIVPVVNAEIAAAKAAGAFVVYTQDWHPPKTPHFIEDGGVWPVHCVRDTWGAELHPDLEVDGPIVQKGTGGEDGYSGFTMRDPETGEEIPTDLDAILSAQNIAKIVVVGLAFDVCVQATALDGVTNGYETVVLIDASRPVQLEPGNSERAAVAMATGGAVLI